MRETSFQFEGGHALTQALRETDEQGLPLHRSDGLTEGDWVLATITVGSVTTTLAGRVAATADDHFVLEFEPHDLGRLAALGECAPNAPATHPGHQTVPVSILPPPGTQVLVVGHNPDVSACLLEVLRHHGFSTTVVATTNEALGHLRDHTYRLVLLNLGGPGLDAAEFCRLARRQSQGIRLPIVGLTTESGPGARARALLAGADDALAMPFRWPELSARLLSVMQRS